MTDLPARAEYDNSKQRIYHEWAQFIIDHSRRVHMVSVLIGWGQPENLHDIEEMNEGGKDYVGKFHPLIFRPFSPLGQGDSLEFALTLHRQSRHHRVFWELNEYTSWEAIQSDKLIDEIRWSAVDIIVALLENRSYSPRMSMDEIQKLIFSNEEWYPYHKGMLNEALWKIMDLPLQTRVELCKELDIFIEKVRPQF